MICIKTGMSSEERVARTYAAKVAVIVSGKQTVDTLSRLVPSDCQGIISFGLCGGLAPTAQIGQAFIYSRAVTPLGTFNCDAAWRKRLFAQTRYSECSCWSSGEFNSANSITQRQQLFAQTACAVIDDETMTVAQFAADRKIPFIGLRVVSDGAQDNLPPAVLNALNTDGSTNIWRIIESVVTDPLQIPALIRTATEFSKAIAELRTAALQAGPEMGFVAT